MSSHREAPEISKDPTADNTDTYAFVSPDKPDTVTLIANYLPFELPYGGPNFNEFADDVVYDINISNRGDAYADIVYRFRFHTTIRNPDTFLYNLGPISSPTDKNWNRPQTYTLTKFVRTGKNLNHYKPEVLGRGLSVPPVNVGAHSTPHYPDLAAKAYHELAGDRMAFAGQRADAFHVDLGSIFDLGDLRPFQDAYNHALAPVLHNMPGVNGLQGLNVHTLALQLPIKEVTRHHNQPKDVMDAESVIGVWATASRARASVRNGYGTKGVGGWIQVSRLGNPLINEVVNPMSVKDRWNGRAPHDDHDFAKYVLHPELATLISTVLYPDAFPNLAKYVAANKPRNDLAAILLTGIPTGVVPGFQNYTGPVAADMLRLNVAVPPAKKGKSNPIGLVAGDPAGFPNGRRIGDDVTAIELKAVAGATIPLVDPSFEPDAAAALLNDGTTNTNTPYGALLPHFPYLSNPNSGFTATPGHVGGGIA
jgi:hypothetical protein